ncbi:MAG: hypothetical protein ACN4GF_03650 [Lentimonas sp.]
MKYTRFIQTLSIALALPFFLSAQAPSGVAPEGFEVKEVRPKETDNASRQLIQNFLTVTGGKQTHIELRNIVATGVIEEASRTKRFKLVETQDGKRKVTYTWRHLGHDYQEVYAFDGVNAWTQMVKPKEQPVRDYTGQMAEHFKRQHWLLQPLVLPLKAPYVFKYQGMEKVSGRPAYVVVGWGKNDERSWFYFDEEKFLLTRWGGIGTIAGVEEYMDYSAIRFAKVEGVLLPKEINLLAEGKPFGKLTFDGIQTNREIDTKIFNAKPSRVPILRQRVAQ